MKFLTRQAITCAFLLACSSLFSFRSQTVEKKTSTSTVSGTVTMKGKGVAGITVVLTGQNPNGPQGAIYQAKTDQEGHYRIGRVPAGPYQVRPEAPAYVVSMKSGETTLIIDEGETIGDINFTLAKGGVITGRITTTERQPLIEQMVVLMPAEREPNSPEYFNSGAGHLNAATDDRGVYRIFSVPAGKYKVYVGQGRGSGFSGGRRLPVRQTFYPSVEDSSKATIVEVSEGSESTNIDITVDTNDTSEKFSVSGSVIDGASGQPLSNIRLYVYMQTGGRSFGPSVSDVDGQFKLEGLPPGQYILYGDPRPGGDRATSTQFEVTNANVNGLVVKTVKVSSVSGQIILEDSDKSLRGRPLEFQVGVSVHKEGGSSGTSVPTQNGGIFKIDGLGEGTARFQITLLRGGPIKQLAVSRIERDGVVQPEGVALKEGEQVTGVRIYVHSNSGTVRGVVKFENGELPPGGRVSVWLTQGDSTRGLEGNVPSPYVDSRGHFVVEGLPAGTYEINATAYIPNQQRNRSPTAKQQVSVADGVVSEVTITIDLSPGP